MDLIKKHVDTIIVLGGILGSVMWMNGLETRLNEKIAGIDKRLTVIETVMIMQGHNIKGVATNNTENIEEKK